MIEGLRLLPWWHEANRRGLLGPKSKCETCMDETSEQDRQLAACGYEPPPAENLRPFVVAWNGLGYNGPTPTVCPGYSTSLPETIEIARAKQHWEKGGPACVGITDWQGDPLGIGIEILAASMGEFQDWRTTPAKNGGGGS